MAIRATKLQNLAFSICSNLQDKRNNIVLLRKTHFIFSLQLD